MKQHAPLVLLEPFDGDLEDAGASASQEYASASRSFQEARELLARVESARATFLLLALVFLSAWLCHPLIVSLQSLVAKARKVRGKGIPLRRMVESRQTWVHLASCPNHRPHVPSLVLQCPRSVRLRLAQLVVDHITLFVFVLISACCVDKLDIAHHNVPTKEKRLHFTWETGIWYLCSGLCSVRCPCYGATVQETEQDQDEEDVEDSVAFSIRVWRASAILDGQATKTLSGFKSIQPVADQYEDTTIETTYVGFTFAGGET